MGMGNVARRNGARFPNKTALIYGDYSITFKELNDRVNRLSNSLLRLGARKGDRLAVLIHNSTEYVEIYFASAKTGCIMVPINNLLKSGEIRQILEYVSPRFLIFDPDYEELASSMKQGSGSLECLIGLRGASLIGSEQYDSLIEQGSPEEPSVVVSDNDVLSIMLTSGTTGMPKGVMRTHRHELVEALCGAMELKIQNSDRTLFLFPFYHVAFVENLGRHSIRANTIVIRREGGFNAKETLEILSRQKVTMCQLVPTMINALVQEKNFEDYDLSHLRTLVYVGSTIATALLKKAIEKFKCQFTQLYGQTEGGPSCTILGPEDHVLSGEAAVLARLASAGKPMVDYEVKIVDSEDKDLPVGEVGEIAVRGETVTVGYWNMPDETAKTLRGGWLHTGDMGRLDEDGYLYIVDRKNDMIISGGKNIYPREIEEVLYRHQAILEATVIGVPDEYWGEAVKAVVALKEGMAATEEEIIAFCKENLASYKKPRGVEFRKELPKNPAGKILKRTIRAEYWKGLERKI